MVQELKLLSAGLEMSGRVDGPPPWIRIVAALPSGATRTIRLSEDEALRVAADLLFAVQRLRKHDER